MPKKEKPKKISLEDMSKKMASLEGVVDGCLKFVTKLAEDLRPALASIQTDIAKLNSSDAGAKSKFTDLEYRFSDLSNRLNTTISELHGTMGVFENQKQNLEPLFNSIKHPSIDLRDEDDGTRVAVINGHKLGEILNYADYLNVLASTIAKEILEKGAFKFSPKKAAEIFLALGIFVPFDTDLEEHKESNAENPFNKEGTDDGDNGHPIL